MIEMRELLPKRAALVGIGLLGLILCTALAMTTVADAKRIKGTKGSDMIRGTAKKDKIKSRGGSDVVKARGKADRVHGGSGEDTLKGGKGKDRIAGGADNDLLKAVDGKRDRKVNGGKGDDTCIIDQVDLDAIKSCETVQVKGDGPTPEGSLELESASGLVCASQLPTCVFQLEGSGAEAPVGTVTGGGGATLAAGAGVVVSGEDWTAAGLYGCTEAGFLTVTIGAESINVPITCETAAP